MIDRDKIRWDLVESNLGLARGGAARFSRCHPAEWDTYYDAAVDGLIGASAVYDPDRGDFGHLAAVAIRCRMIERLRRDRSPVKRPASRVYRLGFPGDPDDPLEPLAPAGPDPDWDLDEMVSWLPDREARALVHYFRDGMTCEEVGLTMGLHKRLAHRAVQGGIDRLARRMTGREREPAARSARPRIGPGSGMIRAEQPGPAQ